MHKLLLSTVTLMILSLTTYADTLHLHEEGNNTAITIKSVRGVLGNNNPIKHTHGQIRAGYITLKENKAPSNSAYGLAAHIHFDTKRWYGWQLGLSAYTVLNTNPVQSDVKTNADFFDSNKNSFAQVTEAYLDGKWGKTQVKLGRQILNTPHTDSDDIRMMPNYFEAYTLTNNDIQGLAINAGYIRKMSGWENGINSKKFVNISQTLGTKKSDGIFYASMLYDDIKDLSLSLWYYHYTDIANLVYAEVGYELHFSHTLDVTLGAQYNSAKETQNALLGQQDTNTIGASIEITYESIGMHVLAAYNQDSGESGASSLNLGGGALFTSMEDQTLDVMGQAGKAWVLGAGYHFEAIGLENLNAGVAYGSFTSDDLSYQSNELDIVIKYSLNEYASLTAAYASVSFKTSSMQDYTQFRVIANYNF